MYPRVKGKREGGRGILNVNRERVKRMVRE
jgi:hypothetical protein